MCCMMPATCTFVPSHSASTSTSTAPTGSCPAARACPTRPPRRGCSAPDARHPERFPSRGRPARRTGGSPADSRPPARSPTPDRRLEAMPLTGLRRPSLFTSAWNRSRSSARSMASGVVPRIGMPASCSAFASFSGVCPPNCTITPCSVPLVLLDAQDFQHVFQRQRLEIQPVRRVVVGADRFRVAVDHDRLIARIGQREAGVAAAIVELDPLADPVGTAAQDDDLLAVRRARLAFGVAHDRGFIGGIHVGRLRLELGRAGVDPLEHGVHAQVAAGAADLASSRPVSAASRASVNPIIFSRAQAPGVDGQARRCCAPAPPCRQSRGCGRRNHGSKGRGGLNLVILSPSRMACAISRSRSGRLRLIALMSRRARSGAPRNGDLVEPAQAGFHAGQRLLQRFVEGAADRHRLAHRFHRGGQLGLGARELFKSEARDLGHDIIDGRLEAGGCHFR